MKSKEESVHEFQDPQCMYAFKSIQHKEAWHLLEQFSLFFVDHRYCYY